ncbi:MAG: hypothetical protein E7Z84_04645 [Methanosphaera stadtmanae]|nr:hypothetical protein [Methanosphaera stadtmanae]
MIKNVYIAVILSFLITGLGNVYNGLIKRGIAEFIISLILGLLAAYVHWIIGLIGLGFAIYVLFDTYECTKAINEGKKYRYSWKNLNLNNILILYF